MSRFAFHNPDVIRRAAQDYDALATTTRRLFIPFAEALPLLHTFVAELSIPE